ncbi:MAG: polysaccharide biosynthesis tyrosine autokinase [Verrucomicrobiota bacterium]
MNEFSSKNQSPAGPAAKGGLAIPAPVRNWRDYLLMIRERWLIGMSLGLLASCLFAYFGLREAPMYRSSATLMIESKADRVVDIKEVVDTTVRSGSELQNHLSQMRSRSFSQRVVQSFSEREAGRITEPYHTEKSRAGVGGVVARSMDIRLPAGQVFYFESKHRDPEMAALIANRYVNEYIQFLLERTTVGETSANQFLQAKADELKKQVKDGEQRLEDFRRTNNMVSLDESQNVIAARLQSLNGALTSARVSRLEIESKLQQVEAAKTEGVELLDIPVIAQYGNIPELVQTHQGLVAERKILGERYLERHPKMIDNSNRMEVNQDRIENVVDQAISDLTNQLSGANRQFDNLKQEMANAEQESLDLDEMRISYNAIAREVDSSRKLYNQILSRMHETTISAQLDNTNVRILDEAVSAGRPFSPDRKGIITKAVGLFFIVFIGAPILLELVNNRLHGYWDIHVFLQREMLGEIPRSNRVDPDKLPVAVRDELNDSISESFRVLYGQITMLSERDFPKSILITSTVPGEGKSTVISNLAQTFAKHGKKVVLIDFDLRRPVIHRYYQTDNEGGLMSWWNSHRSVQESIPLKQDPDLAMKEMDTNLSVLTSGGSSKNATELLSDPKFSELLFQLKKEFDLVLIDTPPAGIFVETLQLGELVDEVIYIARQNAVNRNKAKRVLQDFDRIGVSVLGIILNSVKGSGAQRYGYYGYSYSSTDYVYRYYQRRDRKEKKNDKKPSKKAKEKNEETVLS